MVKRLILITGMSGSGKTTLVTHFKKRGVASVTMGDVIRSLAQEKGLPPTPENLEMPDDVVLVDGIRSIREVEVFSKDFEVTLVAIFSDQKTRYARLKVRGRSDDPKDMATFKARDDRELSFSLGHAIALADYTVLNEGSLEDLENEFESLRAHLEWM
jgi:dephospho-CoA kinase